MILLLAFSVYAPDNYKAHVWINMIYMTTQVHITQKQ